MKSLAKKGFTLVELLVVITILAIISVVAYQNFWWAVGKAVSGRKISDVSTIETSLQQYKVDKNHYPAVDELTDENKWWYDKDGTTEASASNTIQVEMNWAEIQKLVNAKWWWAVKFKNSGWNPQQIWAKWTISQTTLTKQYLTKDLYDPEVWDIKIKWAGTKMIDYGVWRYVYWVYRKPTWGNWTSNQTWTYYNIAFTIKKDDSDTYVTKVLWDYDNESCFDEKDNCPKTLIGSMDSYLLDWQEQWKDKDWNWLNEYGSNQPYQWIPYAVDVFEE